MRKIVVLLMGAALLVWAAEETPRPSPPLSIERPNAPPVTLTQFRGKVVALAFIFTSCSHCQELTQTLNRLAPQYTARGVQFLECAFNGDAPTAMQEFLARYKPLFPVGWSSETVARAYLRFPVTDRRTLYVPHMIFLDGRGMIRSDFSGESGFFANAETSIRAELEKLLASGAGSSKASGTVR